MKQGFAFAMLEEPNNEKYEDIGTPLHLHILEKISLSPS